MNASFSRILAICVVLAVAPDMAAAQTSARPIPAAAPAYAAPAAAKTVSRVRNSRTDRKPAGETVAAKAR